MLEKPDSIPQLTEIEEGSSLGRDAWLRLKKNKLAMLCIYLFIAITIFCFMEWPLRFIGLTDPNDTNLDMRSSGPSAAHWFGTDALGRDILTRIQAGGQISLMVGFVATFVSITIGVLYGTISGYIGGRVDSFMMRVVDVLYSLPFTMIVILLMVALNSKAIWLLFVAIGMVEWLTMARIVRGQILSLKQKEFVEAAVSLGYGSWRIMLRHLIPNVTGPVIIYTTLTVPAVMRLEAVLSFLGLGVQPPDSSWGTLIKEGADQMISDPLLLFFPALFFSLTLFCLNFLGDGLRDALDPKSSKD